MADTLTLHRLRFSPFKRCRRKPGKSNSHLFRPIYCIKYQGYAGRIIRLYAMRWSFRSAAFAFNGANGLRNFDDAAGLG